MSLLRAALLASFVLAPAACSNAPASGDCEKLFQHLVEVEHTLSKASETQRAERAKRVQDNIGAKFVARCNQDLPGDQVACALKATTREAIGKCD